MLKVWFIQWLTTPKRSMPARNTGFALRVSVLPDPSLGNGFDELIFLLSHILHPRRLIFVISIRFVVAATAVFRGGSWEFSVHLVVVLVYFCFTLVATVNIAVPPSGSDCSQMVEQKI